MNSKFFSLEREVCSPYTVDDVWDEYQAFREKRKCQFKSCKLQVPLEDQSTPKRSRLDPIFNTKENELDLQAIDRQVE